MAPATSTERRVHKVYVTRNTEYHVRRDVCVAVRDRNSGAWLREHAALRTSLRGALRIEREGYRANAGVPDVGDMIFFRADEHQVVTSRVVSIARPDKQTVSQYDACA